MPGPGSYEIDAQSSYYDGKAIQKKGGMFSKEKRALNTGNRGCLTDVISHLGDQNWLQIKESRPAYKMGTAKRNIDFTRCKPSISNACRLSTKSFFCFERNNMIIQ